MNQKEFIQKSDEILNTMNMEELKSCLHSIARKTPESKRESFLQLLGDCCNQDVVKDMEAVLNSDDEIDRRVYAFPASSIEEDGKKISYFEFISSLKNPDCTAALQSVSARIDMGKISTIINQMPVLLPS